MFFQVLSHACMLVRHQGKTLLTDPWLVGSCYWRSWWNYPPVAPALIRDLVPDAIYITHIHWDHFHGPSLKHFSKDTQIIIPYERSTRISRDLLSMGFRNLVELKHGEATKLADDFKISSYQFSPWGDSAVIVEGNGVCICNANDAKFMGGPLDQIIKRHAPFDFVLRSHSSANDRVCYEYTDEAQRYQEDPDLYARAFYNFIEKTRPKYAVPFASNHCHLHKEVYDSNRNIETPRQVEKFVQAQGGFSDSKLQIMLSGDSWDSNTGFNIAANSYFVARDQHIEAYREANRSKLEKTYQLEARVKVRRTEVEKFFSRFKDAVPDFLLKSFAGRPVYFCAISGDQETCFEVDIVSAQVKEVTRQDMPQDALSYEVSAIILKKAMAMNMFSHIGISKRVRYRSKKEDTVYLKKLNTLLAAYEYEVLPLARLFSLRTMRVYARRWRELLLYMKAYLGLRRGWSKRQLEEKLL